MVGRDERNCNVNKMAAHMAKHFGRNSLVKTLKFSNFTCLSLIYIILYFPIYSAEDKEFKVCKTPDIFYNFLNLKICGKFTVSLIDFKKWEFEENNLLYETFPLDFERRNYCREVKKAVFSYVEPVPLKTKPSLVAISTDVLENILDIDSNTVRRSEKFLHFASGNTLIMNSVPLSHRYGGHQVFM